jgi:hypothetical protein
MLWEMVFAAIYLLAILWAAGFDFDGVKDSMVGAAEDNAEGVMGTDLGDDWGA